MAELLKGLLGEDEEVERVVDLESLVDGEGEEGFELEKEVEDSRGDGKIEGDKGGEEGEETREEEGNLD